MEAWTFFIHQKNLLEQARIFQSKNTEVEEHVTLSRNLCNNRIARSCRDLLKEEISSAVAHRKTPSIFYPEGHSRGEFYLNLWDRLAKNPSKVEPELAMIDESEREMQEQFNHSMKKARRIIKEEDQKKNDEEDNEAAASFRDWYDFWQRDEDSILSEFLQKILTGLDFDAAHCRTIKNQLDRLPSLRMLKNVTISYSFELLQKPQCSTKSAFSGDLHHSLYAAHSDGFVSNDEDFRCVLENVPKEGRRCKIYSWNDFRDTCL